MSIRDPVLFAIVFGSIPFILRKPHVGILMWVWLSVMNPHRLTWSVAYSFNFAAIIAVVTLVSTLINKKECKAPPLNSLTMALLMFFAWTGVTTIFAFYPGDAFTKWSELMKTMIMAFLIPMLFHRQDRTRQLIWVTVLSIAYYGTKGGLWVLLTGGGNRVWGPANTYINDNNALAVAVVMLIPLLRYLQLTSPRKSVRHGLTVMMLLCGVSAIGSHSRGALIAIAAMVLFFCWKTRRKLQVFLVVAFAVPVVLSVMPESWYTRMDTINHYEEDSSALMRLNAWGAAINLANDHPFVGGGFESATDLVYRMYAPDLRWPPQVAHSIYFQALGEHGYVGLFLYLWLYFMFWRHAKALARVTAARPDLVWAHDFGLMVQVTLVAFAAGAAFLSLILFDVPYYLLMILIVMRKLADEELLKPTAEVVMAPPPWASLSAISQTHSPKPRTG
jgi:putative inorganic carbon (HCO3(-)) transporter